MTLSSEEIKIVKLLCLTKKYLSPTAIAKDLGYYNSSYVMHNLKKLIKLGFVKYENGKYCIKVWGD